MRITLFNLLKADSINGRVIHVDRHHVWLACGNKLMCSDDHGQTWSNYGLLPVTGFIERFSFHPLARRLGRLGFHHLSIMGSKVSYLIAHHNIFRFGIPENEIIRMAPLVGSRPLNICTEKGVFRYGEYISNIDRGPVYIWQYNQESNSFIPLWCFKNVRHVHGVFFDPYSDSFWVTTGDYDDEIGIWHTNDNFASLNRIVGRSQQFRAVQLLFSYDHIYFGSDAPDEHNCIYRMNRDGKHIEMLSHVNSSVFYGCKVGPNLFFSTAVEPSRVNTTHYAEVWGSGDHINWQLICRFKKDFWPMKYFQYGQVLFPSGPGDGKYLWITPFATEYDQQTFKIPIESILK